MASALLGVFPLNGRICLTADGERNPLHSARPILPHARVKQSFIFVTLIPTRSLNKRRRTIVVAAGDSLKLSAPTLQEIKVDKEPLEGVCLRARGRNVEHNAPK